MKIKDKILSETSEEVKQRVRDTANKLVMKQETLEEAAVINYKKLYEGEPLTQDVPIDAFKQGAKWQQERSYSEEEVYDIVQKAIEENSSKQLHFFDGGYSNPIYSNLKKWFETYKKK